jgi:glycine oxidase
LAQLEAPVFFRRSGTLVLAHPSDASELERLRRRVDLAGHEGAYQRVNAGDLEPDLADRFPPGLFFADEGQLDNRVLLDQLLATSIARGVRCQFSQPVEVVGHEVRAGTETYRYDWVLDCRGLGAPLPDLRGVRGELVHLETREITLARPVRLVHPRYPLYIAPRSHHRFVVGATLIESDDLSPISARSLMELLGAAYTIHPAFAEARVLETVVERRPAFPDNRPRIQVSDGLCRVNGLYRHGYLVSPALTEKVARFIDSGVRDAMFEEMP